MPDDPIAEKSFFLTRQIANLMEDFARETSRSSSVYLLYGDASVGKSRVLDELASRHFSGSVVHRVDLNTDTDGTDKGNESAEENSNEVASKIQRLMQDASDHEIIIADHFESASNRARHQMFQRWAIDGLDKKLNLIIAADTSHFDEVRQLAKQYQASVKSFNLKPFSRDEIEAFVSFCLFPTESSGQLSMPGDIRKQLKQSRGLVGKLIEIVSSEEVSAAIKFDDKTATFKKPLILVSILSVILLVASFLYPLSDQQDEPPSQAVKSDIADSPEVKPKQPAGPDLESQKESTIIHQDEDSVKEVELIPADIAASYAEATDGGDQELTRFQHELKNSLTWIENSDKGRGTIQIMSIGFDGFADNTYYDYLDKLIQQDIDVSRVRIFQTRIEGLVVYSVIFGEYENRREASKSIPLLPKALKANKPIPRTIGGIWDEIFLSE